MTANGTLTFQENQLAKSIVLSPRLDGEPEQDKMFRLLLSEVKGKKETIIFILIQNCRGVSSYLLIQWGKVIIEQNTFTIFK